LSLVHLTRVLVASNLLCLPSADVARSVAFNPPPPLADDKPMFEAMTTAAWLAARTTTLTITRAAEKNDFTFDGGIAAGGEQAFFRPVIGMPLYAASVDGTGQKVALIETGHAATADLQKFDQRFNLPAPRIKEYYAGGKKFSTKVDGETALDVEWLHALAPGARIQIYYLKNDQVSRTGWQQMGQLIRSAASNGAGAISISLGTCGTSGTGPATPTSAGTWLVRERTFR